MKQSPLKALVSIFEPVFRRPDYIQAAALCLREGNKGREVLLISSLKSERWILPKGWPMKGRTLAGAALQEAWEEAGVVGRAEEGPVGYYTYRKIRAGGLPVSCRVEVFNIVLADLVRDYPERKRRKRVWMPLEDAAAAVEEPELKALLLSL